MSPEDGRRAKGKVRSASSVMELKTRQAAKLREIREALIAEGYDSLHDQASALGLSRSTTWSIVKSNHKSSGLSITTLNRMLAARRLPPLVRKKILEYVEEKSAGRYGGNKLRLRLFIDSHKLAGGTRTTKHCWITETEPGGYQKVCPTNLQIASRSTAVSLRPAPFWFRTIARARFAH
jgi:hypothetical protein